MSMIISDCTYFPLNETTTATTIVKSLELRIKDLTYSKDEKNAILLSSIEIAPLFVDIISSYVQVVHNNDYSEHKSVLLGAIYKFGEALDSLVKRHLDTMSVALGLILLWVPIVNMLMRSERILMMTHVI